MWARLGALVGAVSLILLSGCAHQSATVTLGASKSPFTPGTWPRGLLGLRFKVFTVDDKQQRAIDFYVWDSKEAAEAFFTDELRERE